ncbi:MAG TPA: hypothetical protein EYP09_09855 [Anaerolineae bacterium]|nr:hypothetical protein [Anaerolineae bacterium]
MNGKTRTARPTEKTVQLPLWQHIPEGALSPPVGAPYPGEVGPQSSLALAIHWFAQYLRTQDYSDQTVRSYLTGLSLFAQYVGSARPLSEIEKAHVRGFLDWLRSRRETAAKTVELRGTALRAFFAALQKEGALPHNPAQDIYPPRGATPLPEILFDQEVEELRQTAARLAEEGKPRPYLVLILALEMGLRLGEIARLTRADIDLSNPYRPVVHVRYKNRRHRHKARALTGPPELTAIYRKYLETIEGDRLFPVTPRTLEYEIENLGRQARLLRRLTARTLRWTWAVRKVREGTDKEKLRRLMGLSPVAWQEVSKMLTLLASPPLG